MKLKTRLIIAFLLIILAPGILFGVALIGFTKYQMSVIEESYGIPVSYENMSDSMQVIGMTTQDIFEGLKEQASVNPNRFLDDNYLGQINKSLIGKHSFLLVRVGDELYYNGSKEDVTRLFGQLPV